MSLWTYISAKPLRRSSSIVLRKLVFKYRSRLTECSHSALVTEGGCNEKNLLDVGKKITVSQWGVCVISFICFASPLDTPTMKLGINA